MTRRKPNLREEVAALRDELTNGVQGLPTQESKHIERMAAADPGCYVRSATGESDTYRAVADAFIELADAAQRAFAAVGLDTGEWDGDDITKDVERGLVKAIHDLAARSTIQSTSETQQEAVEAARYRWLRDEAVLSDPYDNGSTNRSSWNWTIELPTGKRKGVNPPTDTPSFDETVAMRSGIVSTIGTSNK